MTSQRNSYQIHFQLEEELTTVDDVEHTELTIESILGTALLEVFDAVLVENVTVHPSPEDNDEDGWW